MRRSRRPDRFTRVARIALYGTAALVSELAAICGAPTVVILYWPVAALLADWSFLRVIDHAQRGDP